MQISRWQNAFDIRVFGSHCAHLSIPENNRKIIKTYNKYTTILNDIFRIIVVQTIVRYDSIKLTHVLNVIMFKLCVRSYNSRVTYTMSVLKCTKQFVM